MQRAILSCGMAAFLAGAIGCSMCAHPYDYCGPTYAGGACCGGCDTRAGSILAPAGAPGMTTVQGPMIGSPAPAVQGAPMATGPGLTREPTPEEIISSGEVIRDDVSPSPQPTSNAQQPSAGRPQPAVTR